MTTSIIVTGASAGLGEITAGELAALGHHVILACRSVERGEAAAERIRARTPGAALEVLELDLASLDSVRSAAAKLLADTARPPLHALVCNAGVQVVNGVQQSADGHELTFATNHLGHFLLIQLLADHIVAPGRIVLVSSEVHQGPRKSMGFPAPHWQHPKALADPAQTELGGSPKAGRVRYATSKLANLYLTYELAPRVAEQGITVNAFDPGLMPETGLDRDWPQWTQRIYHAMAPVLVRILPGTRSVAGSGSDLAWLTASPDVADVTGTYFSGRRRRESSPQSHDAARAAELWDVSEELVAEH
ncbi:MULTISPECIES: SDR family NAD(P)-dependent oxidoreductase [unclassified Streptomyces]|uniref:SDR family NAD(P)-dependent oxidoreductase n=1 Tax=unclassified Streptomyces TaxID=2593676 RepID=UPI00225B6C40|nr:MULTISPECIES: SDR family NAD(P)-dependent oxidoreductase [unclassified Streptomyces]MCX4883653.1 SDR family NAD(P)-dependent oxidoreductase [Streptomyces sp. NBC_00847]MCX5423752.1 SDR family NAD(P)-dependent oxidoreductase [Streptomyces sp. NBC_00078]